jgi:hypothetical protein
LLHGPARADRPGFQLDLDYRYAVYEKLNFVAVMAVVSVNAQLVDDFTVLLAPVLDVNQGVAQLRSVVALKTVDVAKPLGSAVDIGRDKAVEQALKLAISQMYAVQRFELGSEVSFERSAVAIAGAIGVLKVAELDDQIKFDLLFCSRHEPYLKYSSNLLPALFWLRMPLSSCISTPRLAGIFIRAACTHPFIHLGELKFPKPSHAVRWQPLTLTPTANSVLGHAQVLGEVLSGNPRFWTRVDDAQSIRLKVVLNRLKSTI